MYQGEIVKLGRWPQEPDGPAVPLQWQVLDREPDGTMLLITKDVIEQWYYQEFHQSLTWEASDLRYWLNVAFLQAAFSEDERACILLTQVENQNNQEFGTEGGRDTLDYVYCLSLDEVERLLPEKDLRKASFTPYVQRAGAHHWWWLRSPGGVQSQAANVRDDGYIYSYGFGLNFGYNGVRPVMRVNLSLLPKEGCSEQADAGATVAATYGDRTSHVPFKIFTDAAEALRYGNHHDAMRLAAAGLGLRSRKDGKRMLAGRFGALQALSRVTAWTPQGISVLADCVALDPAVAPVVARHGNLDEVANKGVLLMALVHGGHERELRLLEGHEGYFTPQNLTAAVEVAGARGQGEVLAYLLDQQRKVQESATLPAESEEPGLDLEL